MNMITESASEGCSEDSLESTNKTFSTTSDNSKISLNPFQMFYLPTYGNSTVTSNYEIQN